MPTSVETAIAAEAWQANRSLGKTQRAVAAELPKLGPAGRRALLCAIHEDMGARIIEGDKAFRRAQKAHIERFIGSAQTVLPQKVLRPADAAIAFREGAD